MKRIAGFFWREKMLTLSLLAAAVALTITPFTPARLMEIDWRTLGNLMMMLCVLEGVKQENLLRPVEALAARLDEARQHMADQIAAKEAKLQAELAE